MARLATLVLVITFVNGCATQKALTATGGSRSDGTVKLSFEYGPLEAPQVDQNQGLAVAKQRCAAWGYTGAEPFGGTTRSCNLPSGSGCQRYLVTVEYQCTGTPPAPK